MTPKKRRRKGPVEAYIGFLRGLAAGDMGPVERSRTIAGNFFNRYWGRRTIHCCGNYGDPGC